MVLTLLCEKSEGMSRIPSTNNTRAIVIMRRRESGVTGFLKLGMYLLAPGFSLSGVLTVNNLSAYRDSETRGLCKTPHLLA